jgi:hypothetical protein
MERGAETIRSDALLHLRSMFGEEAFDRATELIQSVPYAEDLVVAEDAMVLRWRYVTIHLLYQPESDPHQRHSSEENCYYILQQFLPVPSVRYFSNLEELLKDLPLTLS